MAMRRYGCVTRQSGPFKSPSARGQADAALILNVQNLLFHKGFVRPGGSIFLNAAEPGDYLSIDATGWP